MKYSFFIATCILAGLIPASASVRLGLGNAVAKRSAELINKAGDNTTLVGDAAAAKLPACSGSPFYTVAPADINSIAGVVPLGNLNPSGHTFPSDHIYPYIEHTSTGNLATPALTISLYAPGDVTVTAVISTDYLSASPVVSDYSVTFYACRDVKSYYAHIKSLSPSLLAKSGALSQGYCSTYSTGGSTFRRCDKSTNFTLNAGDFIGTAGGTTGPTAFDFGSADYRITPLTFVSPSRHIGDSRYTACPLDYFVSSIASSWKAKLGSFDGTIPRTVPPICGTTAVDVVDTAKGYWYKPGAPDVPEDPHLALVNDYVRADNQSISVGTSLPNFLGVRMFTPVSSGLIDRDFSQVTFDGNTYCYDTFLDPNPNNPPPVASEIFLIKMVSSTTLRIEYQNPGNGCAPNGPPWAFGSQAVDFQR